MKRTKLLTISFLCPGKTEDVFKTIESIQPILQKVDSELLIVDTGCSPEFRARLEKYTDRIIPFTWTGDFSEARNVGVDNALGKWFMSIDDDEWFIDTKEIVDFFAKGQYKKFTAALYTVRNFLDYEEKSYTDSPALRMFNIEGQQRWEGKIHEYICIEGEPSIAALGSIAKHFGYIYATDEERMAKSRRNVKPLLEMREEDPDNIYWVYQLVQEYVGTGEYEEAKILAETGIEMIKDTNYTRDNNVRNSLYHAVIMYAIRQGNIEEAFNKYIEITSDKRITDVGKAGFAVIGAELYLGRKDYAKALTCCNTYNVARRKLINDVAELSRQNCLFMGDVFSELTYNCLQLKALRASLMLDKHDECTKALQRIDWNYAREDESVVHFVIDFVSHMTDGHNEIHYSKIIDELVESETIEAGLYGNIIHQSQGVADKIKNVAECFIGCKSDKPIIHRMQVLATSDQMRVMAGAVMTQIIQLRAAGQNVEAESIEGQLNGILEKMPVGGI